MAQIISVLKPGKEQEGVKSYLPISLLLPVYKVLKKLFLQIINSTDHQFGFRQHTTIDMYTVWPAKFVETWKRKITVLGYWTGDR